MYIALLSLLLFISCNENSENTLGVTEEDPEAISDTTTSTEILASAQVSRDDSTSTYDLRSSEVDVFGDDIWINHFIEGWNDSISIAFYLTESIEPGIYYLDQEYEEFNGIRYSSKVNGELNFYEHKLNSDNKDLIVENGGFLKINSIRFKSYEFVNVIESIDAEFEVHAENSGSFKSDSIHIVNGILRF